MSKIIIIWTCKNCGFDNPEYSTNCNSCSSRLKSNLDNKISRKRTQKRWLCPQCNAKNMEFNTTCHSCYYEIKSSGGCFISTATILSLGKSDNCDELNAFRKYRDNYLAKTEPETIKKYYEIAPKIVEAINQRENSNSIYQSIWSNHLQKCIKLIEADKKEETKNEYAAMVNYLSSKFLP